MTVSKISTEPHAQGEIEVFRLANAAGAYVDVCNIGAGITAVVVPDREGRMADVALGYRAYADYVGDGACFGKTPGRFANRIAGGRFTLDGKEYRLAVNNGPNHLHGGPTGFANRLWQGETTGDGVAFTRTSPDGEEGYPGTLTARIAYAWDDDCCLTVLLEAACDAPTIVNLTNHSYWNLAGENAGSVLGHKLRLRASRWLPTDETLIPTGELAGVAGTPMDFRTSKPLGRDIRADFPALRYGKGYDNCWAVDDWRADEETTVAELYDPKSGRRLSVRSTQPGVQVYTGNWLAGSPLSKSGPTRTTTAWRSSARVSPTHRTAPISLRPNCAPAKRTAGRSASVSTSVNDAPHSDGRRRTACGRRLFFLFLHAKFRTADVDSVRCPLRRHPHGPLAAPPTAPCARQRHHVHHLAAALHAGNGSGRQ